MSQHMLGLTQLRKMLMGRLTELEACVAATTQCHAIKSQSAKDAISICTEHKTAMHSQDKHHCGMTA
eukprot:3080618-Amphidinium_carterae.3